MNREYANVLEFLNNTSPTECELTAKLQSSGSVDLPGNAPALITDKNSVIPQLLWEDVLHMMRPVYRFGSKQEYHALFLRSARQELTEHTHNYFEMIYVLSGSSAHCINGNMETLHAGDLCILSPSVRHIQYQDAVSVTAKVIIRPSYFTNICPGLLWKADYMGSFFINSIYARNHEQYLLFHTDPDSSIRAKILEIGYESLRDDTYSDRIVSGLLMSLLITLARDCPPTLPPVPAKNSYREILHIMKKEYDTITLDALAKRLHYSVPYCSKYIKKLFGTNFSNLLYQIRFQMAEQYLRHSELTVIQISKKLGYENPENFIRAFKKYFHMTPAQYRKYFNPPQC